ncbi:MAG TPA: hypothetical protein VF817_01505 [Patescibacteria group bacterium]
MTHTEIYAQTQNLLSSLARELPSIEEYVFLDAEKFGNLVLRLLDLPAHEQEILAQCVDAAEILIAIKVEYGEKYDGEKIIKSVVTKRCHKEEQRVKLSSLLGSIMGTRAAIKSKSKHAIVNTYGRGGELLETRSYLG